MLKAVTVEMQEMVPRQAVMLLAVLVAAQVEGSRYGTAPRPSQEATPL
jgi:hypothetical protein